MAWESGMSLGFTHLCRLCRTRWLMAKRKSKQQQEKGVSSSCTGNSGEDDWVIVKKQRITILIPPLHQCEPTGTCAADLCANTTEDNPTKNTKEQSLLSEPADELKLVADGMLENISPHPETSAQFPQKVPLKELSLRRVKVNSLPAERIPRTGDKPAELLPRRLLIGATAASDGGVFLNQLMRASNLEKKILRAGGLSNWLASLGLHQFVGLFYRRKVDKFQVVNLSMKKLKDMGAIAVGPRRKLMHAIDCLCQPYCFQSRQRTPMQLHKTSSFLSS